MKQTVYKHTCKINGKVYIGVTNKSTVERFAEHCLAAKRSSKFAFHRAILKHGEDMWLHEDLHVVECRNEANLLEVQSIFDAKANEKDYGYNMTAGGDGICELERTQAHKDAIGRAHKGKIISKETRLKLSEYKGEKSSFFGKKQSPEWHAMISEIMTNNHPMKGRVGELSPTAKSYIITLPNGKEIHIVGLSKFCRDNDLSGGYFSRLAGTDKSHKGYKCRRACNENTPTV